VSIPGETVSGDETCRGQRDGAETETLFVAYPALAQRITLLCGEASWSITGASALVQDAEGAYYFELAKPKHWQKRPDGGVTVGVGAIGGSLRPGEGLLACLQREAREEIGQALQVVSAASTHLVYEEALAASLSLGQGEHPAPALCTIGRNRFRRQELPGREILVIVTFLARVAAAPRPADLFGLVRIPGPLVPAFFGAEERPAEALRAWPHCELWTQAPLPSQAVLRPIWTARSLQVALQAGRTMAEFGAGP